MGIGRTNAVIGAGGKKVKTGSITGSGTTSLAIPGLDFEPQNITIMIQPTGSLSASSILALSAFNGGGLSGAKYSGSMSGTVGALTASRSYSDGTLTITSQDESVVFNQYFQYSYILTD